MSTRFPFSTAAALLLLFRLVSGVCPACCDGAAAALRTELEDLQRMKTRLLIDLPLGRDSRCRLLCVANRRSCDPVLRPQRWAFGVSSPLFTAGPVCLEGILAQLYNPLAHGPGSDVFTESAGIALDIDLDVASRKGVQLILVPGHWRLFGTGREASRVQLGSGLAIPFGRRVGCELVGMVSAAPEGLPDPLDGPWYQAEPPFPGGLVSHLAGSLSVELDRARLLLVAAASGGRFATSGSLCALHLSLEAPRAGLELLTGHCSSGFATPEGEWARLEWLLAARADWESGPARLDAGFRREIERPPLLPEGFRCSRDRLSGGAGFQWPTGGGCLLGVGADAVLELLWSSRGSGDRKCRLEVPASLEWCSWSLELAAVGSRQTAGRRTGQLRLSAAHRPSWGKIDLEVAYQGGEESGFHLAAALEAVGEGKRLYLRGETRKALSLEDLTDYFTLRLGWEAELRQRGRGRPQASVRTPAPRPW
ncbi:MAG: hypothetical protein JXB06_06635 [Spirochaetales bacterium]|nr:hypothetical protein [Spirochaetales bacterium]